MPAAAQAVHPCGDRGRKHQEPQENHRRQKAHGRPAVRGNSAAMRPVIGATMSQKPMMKKPARTGPSNCLFTSLTPSDNAVVRINFSKLRFFLPKSEASEALFFIPAASGAGAAEQDTSVTAAGRETAEPPRAGESPAKRFCKIFESGPFANHQIFVIFL